VHHRAIVVKMHASRTAYDCRAVRLLTIMTVGEGVIGTAASLRRGSRVTGLEPRCTP
jgi:hypothetical protein